MLEAGLVALIEADSGMNSVIAGRVYPILGPPDDPTYPYLTYQGIPVGNSDYALDGNKNRRRTIQFDAWGTPDVPGVSSGGFSEAAAVMTALRNLLEGYVGLLNDGTRILFASREGDGETFHADSRAYRMHCDYEFLVIEV